jgi:hypothetical protein
MGFSSGSNQCSAASHEGFSASATESHARPPNAIVNQSHLRPMSAVSQPSLSSRPWSAMSRSSFVGARLLALDSLTEGPGMFQGEIFMLNSIPCEHIASLGHANSMNALGDPHLRSVAVFFHPQPSCTNVLAIKMVFVATVMILEPNLLNQFSAARLLVILAPSFQSFQTWNRTSALEQQLPWKDVFGRCINPSEFF